MKRTLLISEIFPPIHGGSGRWFSELYSRLPKEEYYIVANINDQRTDNDYDKTHSLNLKRFNLSSSSWGIKCAIGLKYYWRTYWQLREHIKANKITHIHCGRCLPEGFIGFLLSKTMGLPLICYVHGEDIKAAATSRELTWLVNRVLSNSNKLICNSKNTSSILTNNWTVDAKKIAILNPGCDATNFIPAQPCAFTKYKLGWKNRKVILTIGRLQKRKGQDMLIKALPAIKKAVPDVLYAMLGGGDEKPLLENLVQDLHLQDHVIFMTDVDDNTMLQCYQQCDLFILPNRTVNQDIEGFGMVLVEAQSCGKTVIAGNSGGTKETMIENKTGFIIDCSHPEPIANKLIKLLQHPDKLLELGKQGRKHVVNNLDWQAHKEKAVKLFK